MNKPFSALVSLQSWGDASELEKVLKSNPHIISVYHMMGQDSYFLDANFDGKRQLEEWIAHIKGIKIPGSSGIPSITSIRTQKIIGVHKQKSAFGLKDYFEIEGKLHFFMYIDNEGYGEDLINFILKSDLVQSMLHIQGEHSFVLEIIAENYDQYKDLLRSVKSLKSVHHVETREVISVFKYRNEIVDDKGSLVAPKDDIREMFTL